MKRWFMGLIPMALFLSIGCGFQHPIIRPATSAARMHYKYENPDSVEKGGYYLQIGGMRTPVQSYGFTHLDEDYVKAERSYQLYETAWGKVNSWLDVGISFDGILPSFLAVQAQIVQESFFKPAVALQTHLGFNSRGMGITMSKSVKKWPSTPCQHLGPLEIMASVSYYNAKENYGQFLPTLEGSKKPEEERDYGKGSKDFFYSSVWVRGPFVMLPLGVEFGLNGVRIGFVRTWRFYLTKTPRLVRSTCDISIVEESDCESFDELKAAVPDFLKNFYLKDDYFKAHMFYIVFAGKAKKKQK